MNRWLRHPSRVPHSPHAGEHILNLKASKGRLDGSYFDIPDPRGIPQHFLRHHETSRIPRSYRTLLSSAMSLAIVAFIGWSAFSSSGLAQSHQSALSDHVLQSFSQLSQALETGPSTFSTVQSASTEPFLALQQDPLLKEPTPLLHQASPSNNLQRELVELGLELSQGYAAFSDLTDTWRQSSVPLAERLGWMHHASQKTLGHWHQALQKVQIALREDLSEEQRHHTLDALKGVQRLLPFLQAFDGGFEPLMELLGANAPQRIVVLLQNDLQSRPTGGSFSAGLEVLVDEGEIIQWNPFHVQELDQRLRVNLYPPDGFSALTDRWGLQTANSSADLAQSAEHIRWFWNREARSSVDTIVLVNTSALERFLQASGVMESTHPEIASQLKYGALRWAAFDQSDQREALKALASLTIAESLQALAEPERFLLGWSTLESLINEQQILVHTLNPDLHPSLEKAGLMPIALERAEKTDHLSFSRLTTSPTANDQWIDDRISLETIVSPEGTLRNQLTLSSRHFWSSDQQATLQEQLFIPFDSSVLQSLGSAPLSRRLTFTVPEGVHLEQVSGVDWSEISQTTDRGQTTWSVNQTLSAGQEKAMSFWYELPWSFDTNSLDEYRLGLSTSPGSQPVAFDHLMTLPSHLSVFQQVPHEGISALKSPESLRIIAGKNP